MTSRIFFGLHLSSGKSIVRCQKENRHIDSQDNHSGSQTLIGKQSISIGNAYQIRIGKQNIACWVRVMPLAILRLPDRLSNVQSLWLESFMPIWLLPMLPAGSGGQHLSWKRT